MEYAFRSKVKEMPAMNRCRRSNRGASTLQMALVLPVLLMLTFGAVDYGYFFFLKNTLVGAAQAGSRAAAPNTALNSDVTTAVNNIMSSAGIASSKYTITTSPTDITTAAPQSTVSVTVSTTWSQVGFKMLSLPYGGISSSKSIKGSASMVKEGASGS
jgi:Flp pilus assembly protein TadG